MPEPLRLDRVPEFAALAREACRYPRDRAARLVVADWLTDHAEVLAPGRRHSSMFHPWDARAAAIRSGTACLTGPPGVSGLALRLGWLGESPDGVGGLQAPALAEEEAGFVARVSADVLWWLSPCGAALAGRQPLTKATVTGRTPYAYTARPGAVRFSWVQPHKGDDWRERPYRLPAAVFAALRGWDASAPTSAGRRRADYGDGQAARDDLGRAVLDVCRDAAGLPPLDPEGGLAL